MPKISVIVPVYKTGEYLKRCIDSIVEQKYTNYELQLIDDGSPDCCAEICDFYASMDSHIFVIHKKNSGVAATKNIGIDCSTGEYLSFVDSDDFIDENYLKELVDSKNKNEDIIIAGLKYFNSNSSKSISELGISKKQICKENFAKEIPALLAQRALNYHVAKLYKRELAVNKNIHFTDFRITGGDDTVFNFDFLKNSSCISTSDKNIYNYFLYNNSTSHTYSEDKWKRSKNLDKILNNTAKEMGILTCEMKRELCSRVVFSAYWTICAIADYERSFIKFYKKSKKIIKDEEYKKACTNSKNVIENNKAIKLIYKGKLFKFWFKHKEYDIKFLRLIHKISPKFIDKTYNFLKRKKNA